MLKNLKILVFACCFAILPAMIVFAGCGTNEYQITFNSGIVPINFYKTGTTEMFTGGEFSANSTVTLDLWSTNSFDADTLILKANNETIEWVKNTELDDTIINNDAVKIGTVTFEKLNKNIALTATIEEKSIAFNFAFKSDLTEEQKQIASMFTLDDVEGNPTLLYACEHSNVVISRKISEWSEQYNSAIRLTCAKSYGYFVGNESDAGQLPLFSDELNLTYDQQSSKWLWSMVNSECKTTNTLVVDTTKVNRPESMCIYNKMGAIISIKNQSGEISNSIATADLQQKLVFDIQNLNGVDFTNAKIWLWDTELNVTKNGNQWTYILGDQMPFDFLNTQHKNDVEFLTTTFDATKYEFSLSGVVFGNDAKVSSVTMQLRSLAEGANVEIDKDFYDFGQALYRDYENNKIYLASSTEENARGIIKVNVENYLTPQIIINGTGNTGTLKEQTYWLRDTTEFEVNNSQEFIYTDHEANITFIAGYSENVEQDTAFDISKVTYYIIELPVVPILGNEPAQYEVIFQSFK